MTCANFCPVGMCASHTAHWANMVAWTVTPDEVRKGRPPLHLHYHCCKATLTKSQRWPHASLITLPVFKISFLGRCGVDREALINPYTPKT